MRATKVRAGGQEGSALPLALAAMVLLTVLSVAAYSMSSQNYFQTSKNKRSLSALNVAEAGLNATVWRFQQAGAMTGTFPQTFNYDLQPEGVATVTVTKGSWSEYKFVSKALSAGPEGRAVRSVKTSVFFFNIWNFIMGAGSLTAGGGGINGNTSVTGPFYVRGNLELGGNSTFKEGPLFVRNGNISIQGSGDVGKDSTRVPCFVDGTHPAVTGSTGNFHVDLSINVPDLQLPPLRESDMLSRRGTALSQSSDDRKGDTSIVTSEPGVSPYVPAGWPKAGAPGYKVWDSNGTMASPIGSGPEALVLSAATASFGDPSNDDFAWDNSVSPAKLYVHGTVFVDGPVTVSQNTRYVGNGTIVANGDMTISEPLKALNAYPSEDCLGLVTPTTIWITGNDPGSSADNPMIAGALFATNSINFNVNGVNCYVRGSLLSGNLTFARPNTKIITDPQLPTFLPQSMPGSGQILTFPTNWREGD